MSKPTVGRIVHYVSYGTPGGEYTSLCRAALIAGLTNNDDLCDIVVFNPTGLFFNTCPHREPTPGAAPQGGTWHWPERGDA
jgi:hypothetical protein